MANKNMLKLCLISMLSLSIAGCGNKNTSDVNVDNSNSTNTNTSVSTPEAEVSYDISQEEDYTHMIPEEVLNSQAEIDFLVYIEGQNGTLKDIGNYFCGTLEEDIAKNGAQSRKYHSTDITSIEMARWFAAAQAFKSIAPGVKVNLHYCSISEYPEMVKTYRDQRGHLPQLMWGTEHVVEMLQKGYNTDLSIYSDSEYYQSYNEYCMSRFNYGGFQAGVPIAAEPWGIFVNTDILEESYVLNGAVVDKSTGECSDDYKDWVDNFTWDVFVDAVKKSTNDQHAGLSKIVDHILSYSLDSVNKQFVENGTVDLTSSDVATTIEKLLNYESELSQYCVYTYDENGTGANAKGDYANAHNWSQTQNFMQDEYCAFWAESPWSMQTAASYVTSAYETDGTVIDTSVDYLPYPKTSSDATANTGIAVEGLVVGNQCPIGTDGKEHCYSDNSKHETDVAAYFAMFAGCDPRSIAAQAEIKYVVNDKNYTGTLALPITKRGFKFSYQEEDPENEPAKGFDDNWQYQLYEYFKAYPLYVTNNEEPDVENFSNIMYGLTKILDGLYMIEGDEVTCINYWNEPVLVPDGTETRNIFKDWQSRLTSASSFASRTDAGVSGLVGLSDYVSSVVARLSDVEKDINENSELAWALLQENVDQYYGEGYNVLDRTSRNDYEGHK